MEEIWKNIEGYEGLYQVSNLGRIKSLERIVPNSIKSYRIVKEKILKPHKDIDGYLQIRLSQKCIYRTCKMHRLVYSAFLGTIQHQINHKNGIKTDNRLSNLEDITQLENIRHSYKFLNRKHGRSIVPINVFYMNNGGKGEIYNTFKNIKDAATHLNINPSYLQDLLRIKKVVTHKNFIIEKVIRVPSTS